MTNFEELWSKLGDATQTVLSATRHAADSARTSIQIAAQEDRIKRCYTVLGRLYCQAVDTGKAPEGPDFQEQLRLIQQAREKIRQYRQQCPGEEGPPAEGPAAPTAQEEDFEPEPSPETPA